jgi:hypothetical protein
MSNTVFASCSEDLILAVLNAAKDNGTHEKLANEIYSFTEEIEKKLSLSIKPNEVNMDDSEEDIEMDMDLE